LLAATLLEKYLFLVDAEIPILKLDLYLVTDLRSGIKKKIKQTFGGLAFMSGPGNGYSRTTKGTIDCRKQLN
jgi:hypothetical protein